MRVQKTKVKRSMIKEPQLNWEPRFLWSAAVDSSMRTGQKTALILNPESGQKERVLWEQDWTKIFCLKLPVTGLINCNN